MLVLAWLPMDILWSVAYSMVSSMAAWVIPSIMADIQTLALSGTLNAGGPSGSHDLWGGGGSFTGAKSSGTNISFKTTSLLMDARRDMARQVSSMRSPGSSGDTNIHRLWEAGGSATPFPAPRPPVVAIRVPVQGPWC